MQEHDWPIIEPYNPLDKINLGQNVANTLVASQTHNLPASPFIGAGVYALYYIGDFPPYRAISERNQIELNLPIYVGKAVPAGARKGINKSSEANSSPLFSRLAEHYESLCQVSNLSVADFKCKYLVVDDIWIPLSEAVLINRFKPLWNVSLDGFGNHNLGSGRLNQKRSAWDCIHKGRAWANKLKPNVHSESELLSLASKHLKETLLA